MADETEVLDWGNEEEERVALGEQGSFAAEEDAVSLGGDEEDEFLAHQSRVPQRTSRPQTPLTATEPPGKQDAPAAQAKANLPSKSDPARADTPSKYQQSDKEADEGALRPSSALSRPIGKLTHALPPKPLVTIMPFVHPSHPSTFEATAMASLTERNKRDGVGQKAHAHDNGDSLPPGWEVKLSRSTGEVYYYNSRTQESTWTQPGSTSFRDQAYRSEVPLDRGVSSRNGDVPSRTGRSDGGDMSYEDRHYRPGENGRRDDRSGQTHSGDSYQALNRQNDRSLMPSRTRDSERGLSSRRPPSPVRSDAQSVLREAPALSALSSEDRVWIASDMTVEPRSRERRHHDSAAPPNLDRRHPEDADKSAALRPGSPVIYTRDSQDSATLLHSSSKSAQPPSDPSASRHNNRFSQSAIPRADQTQTTSRNSILQQSHDDTSTLRRSPADDIPVRGPPSAPRSLPDTRGSSSVPIAAEVQRSHRRPPLPPQSAIYREGSRQTSDGTSRPARTSAGDMLGNSMHERGPRTAHTENDIMLSDYHSSQPVSTRGRTSLPPKKDDSPDRIERDPPHNSRRGKSRGKAAQVIDSYAPNESSISRERDSDSMDIDDAQHRPSDLTRYPARLPLAGDELKNRTERNPRSGKESIEPGQRRGPPFPEHPHPESSATVRSAPAKDEDGHHPVRDCTYSQTSTRLPPTAPGVRLSGTNNIPIGSRIKFNASAPSQNTRPPVISTSNAEPLSNLARSAAREGLRPASDVDMTGPQNVEQRRPPTAALQLAANEPSATSPIASTRLVKTRFGPPINRDASNGTRRDASPESPRSFYHPPDDASRATPPPTSRESSILRIERPDTQGGLSRHADTGAHVYVSDKVRSPTTFTRSPPPHMPEQLDEGGGRINQKRDVPAPTLAHRRRTMDTYVPERTKEFQDAQGDHYVVQPLPTMDTTRFGDRAERGPVMHPERALLLHHGLPPRPQVDVPRSHSGRPPRRDKADSQTESSRGGRRLQPPLQLPGRPSEVTHVSPGRGGSLLDRLAPGGGERSTIVPTKRDREMMSGGTLIDHDGDGSDNQKRARRRSMKSRKSKFSQ